MKTRESCSRVNRCESADVTVIHAHADLAAAKITVLLRFTPLDWLCMNVGVKKTKYEMLLSNLDNLFKD